MPPARSPDIVLPRVVPSHEVYMTTSAPNPVRRVQPFDFDELTCELLVALRGRRSQVALSRRLRFRFNQIYRWESGSRKVRWSDFTRICQACGVDLPQAVRVVTRRPCTTFAEILESLAPATSHATIARRSRISRQKVQRIAAGELDPDLGTAFRLLHNADFALFHLLDELLDESRFPPMLRTSLQEFRTERQEFAHSPAACAIDLFLETCTYRKLPAHDSAVVARGLGFSLAETERLLGKLESIGLIEMVDGKYRKARTGGSIGRADAKTVLDFVRHFHALSGQRLEAMSGFSGQDAFMLRLLPMSRATYEQVLRLGEDFIRKMSETVVRQEPLDVNDVYCVSLNLVNLSGPRAPLQAPMHQP